MCSHLEETEVCLQLESESREEEHPQGLKRGFLCIAWGGKRLPHTETGADWRGKVHPCSDIEERQERQRGTQKPEHLALSDTWKRRNREQCSNTTQPSWTLLSFKGICSHLQRHLHTKLHSPVNQVQHAFLCFFTTLLVSSCPS